MPKLFGEAPKIKKLPTGTAGQEKFFNQFIQQLMQMQGSPMMQQAQQGFGQAQGYLSGLLGPGAFEQFAQPYNQQFEQKILPGIENRYAGFGNSSGALSSSGFGQAIGGAASDFQSQLAQLFSQLQMQASGGLAQNYGNLQNIYNQQAQLAGAYQPFAYQQTPGSQGYFLPLATSFIQAAGQSSGKGGGGAPVPVPGGGP